MLSQCEVVPADAATLAMELSLVGVVPQSADQAVVGGPEHGAAPHHCTTLSHPWPEGRGLSVFTSLHNQTGLVCRGGQMCVSVACAVGGGRLADPALPALHRHHRPPVQRVVHRGRLARVCPVNLLDTVSQPYY